MPKFCSKEPAPNTAALRVHVDMTLTDILALLAEHHITVWHMHCDSGQVMLFMGEDAPALISQIYDFLYAKGMHQ